MERVVEASVQYHSVLFDGTVPGSGDGDAIADKGQGQQGQAGPAAVPELVGLGRVGALFAPGPGRAPSGAAVRSEHRAPSRDPGMAAARVAGLGCESFTCCFWSQNF